jgi:hypothetical protein
MSYRHKPSMVKQKKAQMLFLAEKDISGEDAWFVWRRAGDIIRSY